MKSPWCSQILTLLALISLIIPASSWTIPTYIDLSFPPHYPSMDAFIFQNGTFLSPNYLASCLNLPIPSSIPPRPLFPITNGRLQFSLTNNTISPSSPDEYFAMNLYISGLDWRNGTYQANPYNSQRAMRTWSDFNTGVGCSDALDFRGMILNPEGKNSEEGELVGMNVTIAVQIEDIKGRAIWEEVDECAYVTLVAASTFDNDIGGICNENVNATTTSATVTPTTSASTSYATRAQ